VSHERIGSYLNLASATVVNAPTNPVLVAGSSSNKPALLLVLVLVGFIIAISLAFLMEYLDDRIAPPTKLSRCCRFRSSERCLALPPWGNDHSRATFDMHALIFYHRPV